MYIQFDLSSIPASATVESATLTLTGVPFEESPFWYRNEPHEYLESSTLSLYEVESDWSEESITDFVASFEEVTYKTTAIDEVAFTAETETVTFDVTSAVTKMVSEGRFNRGFVMTTDFRFSFANSPSGSMSYWHSSESEEIGKRPALNVVYRSESGELYQLTVINGTGSGLYSEGERVIISANDSIGAAFDTWLGTTNLDDLFNETTTLTMPDSNLTIEATYKDDNVGFQTSAKTKTNFTGTFVQGDALHLSIVEKGIYSVKIQSLRGQVLFDGKCLLHTGDNSIPGLSLLPGVYLITLKNETTWVVTKCMVD